MLISKFLEHNVMSNYIEAIWGRQADFTAWGQLMALLLTHWVTFGKLLNLFVLLSSHL